MDFTFSEDQILFRDNIRSIFLKEVAPELLRELWDTPEGRSQALWALLAEQGPAAVKALKEIAPELRYRLGQAVRMRHVPEIHFHYDDSVDKGERIDKLLRDNPPSEAND